MTSITKNPRINSLIFILFPNVRNRTHLRPKAPSPPFNPTRPALRQPLRRLLHPFHLQYLLHPFLPPYPRLPPWRCHLYHSLHLWCRLSDLPLRLQQGWSGPWSMSPSFHFLLHGANAPPSSGGGPEGKDVQL